MPHPVINSYPLKIPYSRWVEYCYKLINDALQMKNKIKQIWQGGQGLPSVGQELGKTRVGVISASSTPRVVARLDTLHSNADLVNAIGGIIQTRSPTVDGKR